VPSLDLLSEYLFIMELRIGAMLYSNVGNETTDAGHIKCSRGPQVPHPVLTFTLTLTKNFVKRSYPAGWLV